MDITLIDHEEYREIPGFEDFGVNRFGDIRNFATGELKHITRDPKGYGYCGIRGETISLHRAVSLAWVENPNPTLYDVVNHIDGNPWNNRWDNLEWTTYSGNNYHAVNTGLRPDNVPCKIRDFRTGEILHFPSLAQAAAAMGLRKDTSFGSLFQKQFGKLIVDIYELKYASDETPWFYEGRKDKVPNSRYMVIVKKPDGTIVEIFSTKALLKEYQLYKAPYGKSIPDLVKYAKELYPELEFTCRDAYSEHKLRVHRATKDSRSRKIIGTCGDKVMEFKSLTECAAHFSVDRDVVKLRLKTGKDYKGWTFIETVNSCHSSS